MPFTPPSCKHLDAQIFHGLICGYKDIVGMVETSVFMAGRANEQYLPWGSHMSGIWHNCKEKHTFGKMSE
jgi:hypothetical protein